MSPCDALIQKRSELYEEINEIDNTLLKLGKKALTCEEVPDVVMKNWKLEAMCLDILKSCGVEDITTTLQYFKRMHGIE